MKWKDKQVLVTGAGGFIGSHLVEELVKLEAEVTCFLKYNSMNNWGWIESFEKDIIRRIKIITADLKDSDAVRKAAENKDIIFHLGALISIPYSYVNPRDIIQTNVLGTFNVLSAAKENNVKKVIHTSTSEVYGTAQYIPIDEKHPLQGQSPYSASKIGADKIAQSFYLSYNLPVTTIRPFNTYGPRQSARAIIPTIITQALKQNEILLGSLHTTRDFTFVKDIINGFIKIAESKKLEGEVINIGSSSEISIGNIANKIISLIGKKVTIKQEKKRIRPNKSEVIKLVADTKKAKSLLNWYPQYSLDVGLKETISWISKNLNNYKEDYYNI